MDSRRSAVIYGIPMKHLSLITIMHYSRIMPAVGGQRYYTSTAVFLNEVIKLAISLSMALYDLSSNMPPSSPVTSLFSELTRSVFAGDSWKLAIPAMMYTLQNSLVYLAVSNLDAATFQVTYQLKILATAAFSVTMLGRSLSLRKWLSLVLLMVGVAIVQIPSSSEPGVPTLKDLKDGHTGFHLPRSIEELRRLGSTAAGQLSRRSATYEGIDKDFAAQNPQVNASIGLIAVLVACLLSGLAGVYFEKVLKDSNSNASVWIRNVQLSYYSLFPALFIGVAFKDGADIARTGFFAGYNWVVWTAITLQAFGGVIVALVVNYADNIAKNFATSISIAFSCLASVWFFDFKITATYLLGTAVVFFATYLYSTDTHPRAPPIVIADYEKTTIGGEPSYFDLQSAPLKAKVPTRGEALTTSRPEQTRTNAQAVSRRRGFEMYHADTPFQLDAFDGQTSIVAKAKQFLVGPDFRYQSRKVTGLKISIELVPVHRLPDRFRAIFNFELFNAVQSKCFDGIYNTNQNFVLASPTGSGKTVIFELAICRLIRGWQCGSFKIVYMAPLKSLCAERTRDWKDKFLPLNLRCEEMTGDSDTASLQKVQTADIIVTTPEKWDSMTRKWRDHEKLVQLIKLFLIDEVHILNKDRGAALEAVVSRMKSVGSDIRFVALSATVPNSQDIATWLGRDGNNANIPAIRERFGEEFRPVTLQRHVCGYQTTSNPFGFDKTLVKKLPDVIQRYSQKKPIMIFCFTRNSCSDAAKFLSLWWEESEPHERYWKRPSQNFVVADILLGSNAVKEYSDLEIMQMIGRAGRPQFDDSAVAVIMTKLTQVKHYEQLMNGQELLESCLHLNLIEHLNAEIGLGTIIDLPSAKKWLEGTFLRVRLQHNPGHYRIEGDSGGGILDKRLEHICANAISELQKFDLVTAAPALKTTEYGEAMARYYMPFTTMKAILGLPSKPKLSEILSTLAQAHEFREMRFRSGEKQIYKDINSSPALRFPIKVDLAMPAHKVTLVIQAVLGEIGIDEQMHRTQSSIDQGLIFQHANRIVRCMVDCQNYRDDAVGIRNSLMLSRSLASKAWDDSPLVMQQIGGIGPAAVRKLVGANIRTIDELGAVEPSRLEHILNRNPPFGCKLSEQINEFPRLNMCIRMLGQPLITTGKHVAINLAVEVGFMNRTVPVRHRGKPVFIIMLAEVSDGRKIAFCRISAQKLGKASPVRFSATMTSATQFVNCYIMCDEMAGTFQQARLAPDLPPSAFNSIKAVEHAVTEDVDGAGSIDIPHESAPETVRIPARQLNVSGHVDEWGDGGIGDSDPAGATTREPWDSDFVDIDELESAPVPMRRELKRENKEESKRSRTIPLIAGTKREPQQLHNGKWACGHLCKDKQICKHLCCRDGLDKKPKPRKAKASNYENDTKTAKGLQKVQSRLPLRPKKQVVPDVANLRVESIDLSHKPGQISSRETPQQFTGANELDLQVGTRSFANKVRTEDLRLQRLEGPNKAIPINIERDQTDLFDEDFDDSLMEDLPDLGDLIRVEDNATTDKVDVGFGDDDESAYLDDDEEMLDAALVGFGDSTALRASDGVLGEDLPLCTNAESFMAHNSQHPEGASASDLFLTEGPEEHDSVYLSEDYPPKSNGEANLSAGGQLLHQEASKRKRDIGSMPSAKDTTKRCKTGPAIPFDSGSSLSQQAALPTEHRTHEKDDNRSVLEEGQACKDEEKDSVRSEELKSWLAAEFGDAVELVDE
ncbi:hypothetical protein MBLNU459_g1077t2 [Dothideomycetes sp. NU459]